MIKKIVNYITKKINENLCSINKNIFSPFLHKTIMIMIIIGLSRQTKTIIVE